MDMLERVNTTIDYIEEHLLEELHMPIIAKIAGTSEAEIQKTFYALTGISIMEYVRRRRLTLAGFELQKARKPFWRLPWSMVILLRTRSQEHSARCTERHHRPSKRAGAY